MSRPSDDAIWASIADSLRDVVLPAIEDEWARQTAVQLVGLAEYARRRGDDDHAARRERLRVALDQLAPNPLVPWPPDPGADADEPGEAAAAARALAAAVGRDDADAEVVRATLRPILLADLDHDLAETEILDEPFRGRLPDA